MMDFDECSALAKRLEFALETCLNRLSIVFESRSNHVSNSEIKHTHDRRNGIERPKDEDSIIFPCLLGCVLEGFGW